MLFALLGLLGFTVFAAQSDSPWMTWATIAAAVVYIGLRITLRRSLRRDPKVMAPQPTPSESRDEEATWSEVASGCLGLLVFPVALILAAVAFKYRVLWLGFVALGGLVTYVIFQTRSAFRIPARRGGGIGGGRPRDSVPVPPQVAEHIARAGLLAPGEKLAAAIDDSWTDNGGDGVFVTHRRIVAYRGSTVRLDVALEEVKELAIRRMWYPGAGFLGRGEFIGEGPIAVLRLTFRLNTGATRRLRFSAYAHPLYPLVAALLERLGSRARVARTLPGI
jgi:hypothetical protein